MLNHGGSLLVLWAISQVAASLLQIGHDGFLTLELWSALQAKQFHLDEDACFTLFWNFVKKLLKEGEHTDCTIVKLVKPTGNTPKLSARPTEAFNQLRKSPLVFLNSEAFLASQAFSRKRPVEENIGD